jgi:hypothetical protein
MRFFSHRLDRMNLFLALITTSAIWQLLGSTHTDPTFPFPSALVFLHAGSHPGRHLSSLALYQPRSCCSGRLCLFLHSDAATDASDEASFQSGSSGFAVGFLSVLC